MRKQQLSIGLDRRVVEKLDSHAVKKGQKRGEAIESLL
jgi:metal-responsive CopG/Arc/MetJ family transcriptional regulator